MAAACARPLLVYMCVQDMTASVPLKIKSLQLPMKSQAALQALSQLGDSWDVGNELLKGLEEFVCQMRGASTQCK